MWLAYQRLCIPVRVTSSLLILFTSSPSSSSSSFFFHFSSSFLPFLFPFSSSFLYFSFLSISPFFLTFFAFPHCHLAFFFVRKTISIKSKAHNNLSADCSNRYLLSVDADGGQPSA